MKKVLSCFAMLLALVTSSFAAENVIQLPEPQKSGGMPLLDSLADRCATREFADTALSLQEMSNLLWATGGVNRPNGKLVYPTALDVRDIIIYAVTAEGVYKYDPVANTLTEIAKGDFRADTGKQDYVATAAVNLAFVQDTNLWNKLKFKADREGILNNGFIHAGCAAQNAGLYVASQGWAGVVRGSFDQETMSKLLKLSDGQIVKIVQSIGFKK